MWVFFFILLILKFDVASVFSSPCSPSSFVLFLSFQLVKAAEFSSSYD